MPSPPHQDRRLRVLALTLAGVLPCGLVFVLNAAFVLDHFYARAPELLDAGWLAAIVHRSGPLLRDPLALRHYGWSFYSVHVAPLLSLFSMVSYVVPADRIRWFSIVQGLICAPLGLTAYVVSARQAPVAVWRMPLTGLVALAFAFSGQALVAIAHPHFELAIAGLICLLLASVVTRRQAWVWPLFALAVAAREDAGLHVALFAAPLVWINWRGKTDPALHQQLLKVVAGGLVASALGFGIQRLGLPQPSKAWQPPFFGRPFLGHIDGHALVVRLGWLLRQCPYITVPFLGSVALAAARRDRRYLFGWLSATPWLVANLLAYEDGKWQFSAYVGFPFLVSLFWVYLYGAHMAPISRRLGRGTLELAFAGICLASIAAVSLRAPELVRLVVRGSLRAEPSHAREVRGFAAAVNDRAMLGRAAIDGPVAALAVTRYDSKDGEYPGRRDTDSFAFHRDGPLDASLLLDLAANGIPRCTHVLATGYYLCTRLEGASAALAASAPTEEVPALLVYASTGNDHRFAHAVGGTGLGGSGGVVVPSGGTLAPNLATRNLTLGTASGAYEMVWDLAIEGEDAERVAVDAVIDGTVAAKATTSAPDPEEAAAPPGEHVLREAHEQLVVPFTLRPGQIFGARLWYRGSARVIVEGAELRAATPPR